MLPLMTMAVTVSGMIVVKLFVKQTVRASCLSQLEGFTIDLLCLVASCGFRTSSPHGLVCSCLCAL